MSRTPVRRCWSVLRRLAALAAPAVLAGSLLAPVGAQAAEVTPGTFTGYGFDQCLAPTQGDMDAWLRHSPYWAVGIYISGDSRACRNQPNLTPTWVGTQLAKGWRLLPITLGPQASCNPRFPRYRDDELIIASSTQNYRAARAQGRAEATTAVAEARRLGIGEGSTLWYDMEAYDIGDTACRESALWFTSAWTNRLHRLGYVSGVYSSAASGIKALDDARVERPGTFALPDRIWIARWDGLANTSTDYIRSDGWRPGNRMKQYRGGHDETWGGVRINIDTNFLDLGSRAVAPAEERCGGVRVSYRQYPALTAGSTSRVDAAQCLLKEAGHYAGPVTGTMTPATRTAIRRYRATLGLSGSARVGAGVWTALHARGATPLMKYGARGESVRRLQRALNAASNEERIAMNGMFAAATTAAVKRYQERQGMRPSGVVVPRLWRKLQAGRL